VISKSLVKPGMYVTQGLRFIDNNIESIKNKLESVKEDNLMDNVYLKKNE
jgi:hypothetical protein